ncbi:MAG: DMT family transporter [Alphaproteobacteria bacterium]
MNPAHPAHAVDPPARAAALLVLACLFWAGVFVIGRGVRDSVPPMALTFIRFVIAALVLLPIAWRPLRVEWRRVLAAWRWFLVLGVMAIGLFPVLLLLALARTTAINGSLINSVQPVMTVALAYLVARETFSRRQGLGLAASLTGVLVIVTGGDPLLIARLELNTGDLMIVLALVLWTLYTVALRHLPADLHPNVVALAIIVVGIPFAVPLFALEVAAGRLPTFDLGTVATIAYFGVLPSALALLFWNRGVAALGANRAGVFVHLIPVFAIVLAIAFLGEQPKGFHAVGMALVLAGVALATFRRATGRDRSTVAEAGPDAER